MSVEMTSAFQLQLTLFSGIVYTLRDGRCLAIGRSDSAGKQRVKAASERLARSRCVMYVTLRTRSAKPTAAV